MSEKNPTAHPYIPNSVPDVKDEMLQAVGAESVEDFFEDVPQDLRLKEPMDLPPPFPSEYALRRHVEGLLARNRTAGEYLSFLGAGCWQHHVSLSLSLTHRLPIVVLFHPAMRMRRTTAMHHSFAVQDAACTLVGFEPDPTDQHISSKNRTAYCS